MDARNIVITGASSGIGAALALRLSADGHRVALAARRQAELTDVAKRAGSNAMAVVTDVTDRGDVERLCVRAVEVFGCIDIWINNAGRGITRSVMELEDEELDDMMAVNVKSALYGMQAVVPHFILRGRGHVINVSSMLSRVPIATYRSAYNAAKAALNALTANLRLDLAAQHPGIQVSLVIPGLVTTDFQRHTRGESPPLPPAVEREAQTPEEVADKIADLIDHPVAEIYTNPQHHAQALRYFQDVGAFEREIAARRREAV
jgi:NADP-dependent 3-hydroxy acid dehydrogenase YdfG